MILILNFILSKNNNYYFFTPFKNLYIILSSYFTNYNIYLLHN